MLGSLVVHGAAALWLATRPAPMPKEQAAKSVVEFDFFTPTQAAEPSSEASEPASAALPKVLVKASEVRRIEAREKNLAPTPPAEVALEPAPVEAPAEATPDTLAIDKASSEPSPKRGRVVDLSPLAAALTMRDALAREGRCEAALHGACGGSGSDAGLAGAKSELGNGPRSLIAMRKELDLKPRADGSYGFEGPSFSATIAADGRVAFDDKIQDLNSLVERHIVGAQINTSEKRRFMASTAALRERLADAAEAENQRHAKVALQRALRAILSDVKRSLGEKRAAIFTLWDDCASDASGSEAQAAIESFVREHLPQGSALAFSAAELSQLNRRRLSRRAFDPYVGSDAGAQPG
jgi:hypothetical protein